MKNKKKLGKLTINGKEVDSEKFIQNTYEKYGINDDFFEQSLIDSEGINKNNTHYLMNDLFVICENGCDIGLIIDITGKDKCPKCGGPIKKIDNK